MFLHRNQPHWRSKRTLHSWFIDVLGSRQIDQVDLSQILRLIFPIDLRRVEQYLKVLSQIAGCHTKHHTLVPRRNAYRPIDDYWKKLHTTHHGRSKQQTVWFASGFWNGKACVCNVVEGHWMIDENWKNSCINVLWFLLGLRNFYMHIYIYIYIYIFNNIHLFSCCTW